MLKTFPSLLLADRLTPLTNTIGFVELPAEETVDAFLRWFHTVWKGRRVFSARRVNGNLEGILRQLEPLRAPERNRIAFVPTTGNWTAMFDNRDRGADLFSDMRQLALRTGHRTLHIRVTLRNLDGVPRQTASLGSTLFHLQGPSERLLRAWVNDSERWAWDAFGEQQPFERPELYTARRIRDRLTVATIAEYAAARGIRPFDADFYAPDGTAIIVEEAKPLVHGAVEVSLEQVQRRLARGWFNPPSYDE